MEHIDKDEDDMSTNSFSSYEGNFSSSSSSSSDSSKDIDKGTSKPSFKIKRKQGRINKKKQEDVGLNKIIKRIEDGHITMVQTSPNEQENREGENEIKIK